MILYFYLFLASSILLFIICAIFLIYSAYYCIKNKTVDMKDIVDGIFTILIGVASLGFSIFIIKLL